MDGEKKVLLILACVLAACVAIVALFVWFLRKDKFKDFLKYALGVAVGFAVCAMTFMAYLTFESNKQSGVDMKTYGLLFYPILAELIAMVVGGAAMLVCSLFGKKAFKIAGICTALLLLGGFVAIMVEMSRYFEIVMGDYPSANLIGMIVSAIVFAVLIGIVYFVGDKRDVSNTRAIVYGAISIAMSFALSYIRLFKLPQGGSITFASLLPLMLYCAMFGTRRGVIVCLVYGLLQAVQDPWIIHPMQFLLDYPLAFGMVGVSGIFIEKGVFKGGKKVIGFVIGAVIAVVGRYACHTCSGVFAFADYANVAKYGTVAAYSLAYNSFVFLDMLVALAAGCFAFLSKSFSAQMERSSDISHDAAPLEESVSADDDEFFLSIHSSQDGEMADGGEESISEEQTADDNVTDVG